MINNGEILNIILLNFTYKKIGQNKVDMLLYKIIMLDFMTIKDIVKILRVDLTIRSKILNTTFFMI